MGQKRKPPENAKCFQLFRAGNCETHHADQHPKNWKEYCDLTNDDDKCQFFASAVTPFWISLDSRHEHDDCKRFIFDRAIVCEIV